MSIYFSKSGSPKIKNQRTAVGYLFLSFIWIYHPGFTLAQDSTLGRWSPPIDLPTHPEQMALLPSGKVLMWPWAPDRYMPPHGPLALWDPSDGTSIIFPQSGIESASGLAFQSNGVLLSAGGDMPRGGVDGNPTSFAFDYQTETLSQIRSMFSGRVFPSATTLADGFIIVTSGLDENKEINKIPEIWNGHHWIQMHIAENDQSRGPVFQFLAPDGRLFRAGPERLTDWLDVTTGIWSGARRKNRNHIRFQGTAVMYAPGKILLAGGCPKHNCRNVDAVATAEVIDLTSPPPSWRKISPMSFPRHSHHATLLPDGTVFISGGTAKPEIFNDETDGILQSELWNPDTEKFIPMALMEEPRHFQSAAILLPDARVLVAGGAFGLSPEEARFSWTAQIFSPPYLQKGSRPVLTNVPATLSYTDTFLLETSQHNSIARVTLLGLSTASQGWNSNQRFNELDFTLDVGGLKVYAPASPNLAPPGFYLLFLLNSKGVPSQGHFVQLNR